jgi:putative ABC transport system permease protein
MLVVDIFRLATRMFRTNRLRTVLTILGISVGIGTILFLVSFGYGLQQVILSQITTSDALLSLDVTSPDQTALKLDEPALQSIKDIPAIEKVSPLVTLQAQMVVGDISSELSAHFADREFFRLEGTALKKGDYYTDQEADKNKIIISASALQLFNISEADAFTKEIKLSVYVPEEEGGGGGAIIRDYIELPATFRISGIIEEEGSNFVYLSSLNSRGLDIKSYSKIKVKVDKEENLALTRSAIIDKGFMVSALSDIIEQANQIFRIIQIVLGLFGIVALIVSAIGMFNTMTIALLERTQEIGIMKALGATNFDIWNMFLGESVIIGFSGGLGGIGIGLLAGELFNYGVNLLAGALGGEKIDFFFTPYWFIIFVMGFSTLVGLVTGFYPASRAAKINCLEALRYK